MLEKPDLPDERIRSTLSDEYGLPVERLVFIPRGADRDTAAYRAECTDGRVFFVKLRRGRFEATTALLTGFLRDRGVKHVIAPIPSVAGASWTVVDDFALLVFPFVAGEDGYHTRLSESQWRDLGRALRRIHTTIVPESLQGQFRRETYDPKACRLVRAYLTEAEQDDSVDPITAELRRVMVGSGEHILDLADRAERLGRELSTKAMAPVLCHGDIHAGNVIVTHGGPVFIVDWDDPVMAPKERDLMFVGAGLWGGARSPQEEHALFYEGYGSTHIDRVAIAYYRYQRIVDDIAVFYQRITSMDESLRDRRQCLRYLQSNFSPEGTIAIAYATDTLDHPVDGSSRDSDVDI